MEEQGDNLNHDDFFKQILQPENFNQVEAHYLSLVIEAANKNSINPLLSPSIELSNTSKNLESKNELSKSSNAIAHEIVIRYFRKHDLTHSISSLKNEIPNTENFYSQNNNNLINQLQFDPKKSIIQQLIHQMNSHDDEIIKFKSTRNEIAKKLLQTVNTDDDNIQPLRNYLQKSLSNQTSNADQSELYLKSSFSQHDADNDEYEDTSQTKTVNSLSINLSEMPPQGVSQSKWNANLVSTVKNIDQDLNEPESSKLQSLSLDPNFFKENSMQSSDLSHLLPNDTSINEWKRLQMQNIKNALESNANSTEQNKLNPIQSNKSNSTKQNNLNSTKQSNINSNLNSSLIKGGLNEDSLETDTSLILPAGYTESAWKEARLQNITDKDAFVHSSSSLSIETDSGINVQKVIADLESDDCPSSKLSFEGWEDDINIAIKIAADEGEKIRSKSIKPMSFLSSSSSNKPPKYNKESSISSINLSSMEIDLDSSMNMDEKQLEAVRNIDKIKHNKPKNKKSKKNGSISSSSTMNRYFESNQFTSSSKSKNDSPFNSTESNKKMAPSLLDSDDYQRKKEELKKKLLANQKFYSHVSDSDIEYETIRNEEEEDAEEESPTENESNKNQLSNNIENNESNKNELNDDIENNESNNNQLSDHNELINAEKDITLSNKDLLIEEEEEESNELLDNEFPDELNLLSVDDETNEEEQEGKGFEFSPSLDHLSSSSTSSSGRLKNVILASSDSEQKDDDKSSYSSSYSQMSPKLVVNPNLEFEIPQTTEQVSSDNTQKKKLKRIRVKVKSSKKRKDEEDDIDQKIKPNRKFRNNKDNSAIKILNGTYDFDQSQHLDSIEEINQGSSFDLDVDDGKIGFEIPQAEEEDIKEKPTPSDDYNPSSEKIPKEPKRRHCQLPKNNIEFLTSDDDGNQEAKLELPSDSDIIKVPFIRKNDSTTQTPTEVYLSPSKRVKIKKKKVIEEESFSTDTLPSNILDETDQSSSDSSVVLKKRELKVYDFETLVQSIPDKPQIAEVIEEEEIQENVNEGFVFEIPENSDYEEEINENSKSENEISNQEKLNQENISKTNVSKSDNEIHKQFDSSSKHSSNKQKKIKVRKSPRQPSTEFDSPIPKKNKNSFKQELLSESSDSDQQSDQIQDQKFNRIDHLNDESTSQVNDQNTMNDQNKNKVNSNQPNIQNRNKINPNKLYVQNKNKMNSNQANDQNNMNDVKPKENKKIAYLSPRLTETLHGSDSVIVSDSSSSNKSKKKKIKIKIHKKHNETESSFSAEFDKIDNKPELKEIGIQNHTPKQKPKEKPTIKPNEIRIRKEIKENKPAAINQENKPVTVNQEIQTNEEIVEQSFSTQFDSILDNDEIEDSESEQIEETVSGTKIEEYIQPIQKKMPECTFSELMEKIKDEEIRNRQIPLTNQSSSSIIDNEPLTKESSQMNNQIEEVISDIIKNDDKNRNETLDLSYSYISSENEVPRLNQETKGIDKDEKEQKGYESVEANKKAPIKSNKQSQTKPNINEVNSSDVIDLIDSTIPNNQNNSVNSINESDLENKENEQVLANSNEIDNNDLINNSIDLIEEEEEDLSNNQEEPSSIMMQLNSIPSKVNAKSESDSESDSDQFINKPDESSEMNNQAQLELPSEYLNTIKDEPSSIIVELPPNEDASLINDNEDSILGPLNEFTQQNKEPIDELKQKQGTLELPKQEDFQKIKKVIVQSSTSSESDNEPLMPLSPRNPYGTPKQSTNVIPQNKPIQPNQMKSSAKNDITCEVTNETESESSSDQISSEFVPLSPKNPFPGIRKDNSNKEQSINSKQNDSEDEYEEETIEENKDENEEETIEDSKDENAEDKNEEETLDENTDDDIENEYSEIKKTVKFSLNRIQQNENVDETESDFTIPSEIQNSSEIFDRNQIIDNPTKPKRQLTFDELMAQIEKNEKSKEQESNQQIEQESIHSIEESHSTIKNENSEIEQIKNPAKHYFNNKVHTGDSLISFISCGSSQFDYSQEHEEQTNQADQIDQFNKSSQIDQSNQINQLHKSSQIGQSNQINQRKKEKKNQACKLNNMDSHLIQQQTQLNSKQIRNKTIQNATNGTISDDESIDSNEKVSDDEPINSNENDELNVIDESSLFSVEFRKIANTKIPKQTEIEQPNSPTLSDGAFASSSMFPNEMEQMIEKQETSEFTSEFEKATKSQNKYIEQNDNVKRNVDQSIDQIIGEINHSNGQLDINSESLFSVEFEKSKSQKKNKNEVNTQKQINEQNQMIPNDKDEHNQIDIVNNSESLFSIEFEKAKKKINKTKQIGPIIEPKPKSEQKAAIEPTIEDSTENESPSMFSVEFEKSKKKINKTKQIEPIIEQKPKSEQKVATEPTIEDSTENESLSMFSVEFEKSKNANQSKPIKLEKPTEIKNKSIEQHKQESESSFSRIFNQQAISKPKQQSKSVNDKIEQSNSNDNQNVDQNYSKSMSSEDSLFTDELENGSLYFSNVSTKRFIKVDQSESSDLIDSEIPLKPSIHSINQSSQSNQIDSHSNQMSNLSTQMNQINKQSNNKFTNYKPDPSKFIKKQQIEQSSDLISEISNGLSSSTIIRPTNDFAKSDKSSNQLTKSDFSNEFEQAKITLNKNQVNKPKINKNDSDSLISSITNGESSISPKMEVKPQNQKKCVKQNSFSSLIDSDTNSEIQKKFIKGKMTSNDYISDIQSKNDDSGMIVVLPSPPNEHKQAKIQIEDLEDPSSEIVVLPSPELNKNRKNKQNLSKGNDDQNQQKENNDQIAKKIGQNKNTSKNRTQVESIVEEESDDENLGEYDRDIGESSSCFSFGLKKLPTVKPNPSFSSMKIGDNNSIKLDQKDETISVPFPDIKPDKLDNSIKENQIVHPVVTFNQETSKKQSSRPNSNSNNASKELNDRFSSPKTNSDLSLVSSEFAFTPKATPNKEENKNLGTTFESIEEADSSLISEIPTSSKPSPDNHQIKNNNISTSAFIDSSFDEEEEEEISIIPKTNNQTSSDRTNIILEDLELFDDEEEEQQQGNEEVVDLDENINENVEEDTENDYEVNDEEIGGFENFLKNSPPMYKNKPKPQSDFSSSQINGDNAFGTVKANDNGASGEGVIQVDSSFEF